MLNNRQVQASDPNIALQFDADLVRKEASRPDGVIPPGWEPTSQNDLASGQFNLLTLAESEMDRQGPNPAILGRQGMDASGRAQQVRQQAGMSEDAVIYKGIHNWELRVYRAMWDRCRQFGRRLTISALRTIRARRSSSASTSPMEHRSFRVRMGQ
jgi:hypothetical protein